MKNKDIIETGKRALVTAGALVGLSKIISVLLRVAQKDPEVIKKFSMIAGGATVLIGGIWLLCNNAKSKSDASSYKSMREADGDLYTIKRMADRMYSRSGSQIHPNDIDEEENDNVIDSYDTIVSEPSVKQASEIPRIDGDYNNNQLAGKLLYREDVMLCYGEEHVAKTSIVLNMVIDIVLRKSSSIMPDDKGVHPPYYCLWYNGEMNDADFDEFFGNYDRHHLDDKISFIGDFDYMTLNDWGIDVEKRLEKIYVDTVVVLDNISCISNSTEVDIRKLIKKIKSIQKRTKKRGFYSTFILIDHINKQGNVAGTYKLSALSSNRIRFSSFGKKHTKITIEKNRKYHDLVTHSYNLLWINSPEGYKSFENVGIIADEQEEVSTDGERKFRGLSESLVKKVYEEFNSGLPYRKIANKYGKSHTYWKNVLTGYKNKMNKEEIT